MGPSPHYRHIQQCAARRNGFDFKTTFHKNPQLTTTYRQKPPIAQYVRRIEAQIAVCLCAICSIYIMPKALSDILTVSILIGGCVFYSPSLPGVCRHFAILPRCNVGLYTRGKMAAHTQAWRIKKRILRLKYLRSKYRLELWAWCKSNIVHRNAQLFVRQFCEHTAQSVPSGGKLW